MKKNILSLCCLIVLVGACTKQTIEEIQTTENLTNSNGNLSPGTITGKVRQFDVSGVEYHSDLNTTTVSIDGSTLSTITDATGTYTFESIPAGAYSLTFTKPKAGTVRVTQILVPGNGTVYESPKLADNADLVFSSALAKDSAVGENHLVFISVKYPVLAKTQGIALVYSETPEIDLGNPESYYFAEVHSLEKGSTKIEFTHSLHADDFSFLETGSKIYLKIYPIAAAHYAYFDTARNETVYTAYGTPFSNVLSVVKY